MDKLAGFLDVVWNDLKTFVLGFCVCMVLLLRGTSIPSGGPGPVSPPPVPGPSTPPDPSPPPASRDVPYRDSQPGEPKVYPPEQNYAPLLPLD